MEAVVLPILDANMTHGTIRAWLKREGEAVRAGEALFEVETDKVNAEVEADTDGIVRQIVVPVGARVPVLSVLAFIGKAHEPVPSPERYGAGEPAAAPTVSFSVADESGQPQPVSAAPAAAPRRASPAARRLAHERGIALAHLAGSGPHGEITRADVEAAASRPGSAGGRVDADFVQWLRRDPDAFAALAADVKVAMYRRHGAHIGDAVRFEPGSIIIADTLAIGSGSVIGADSRVDCHELQLGCLVAFGRRTRVRCWSVCIGDALWSKDDVVIGGGGSDEPGATLSAGSACFFGEGAYLNTGQPLVLADEVCIGSRAMLFTHSHWQSVLRGYPSLFGPIHIGAHVFIGNNAFVFPGVSIAPGATVMVNSFVAVNVPADTLVGGVPAQVIRHIQHPSRTEQIDLVRTRLLPELAAALRERGYACRVARTGGCDVITVDGEGTIVFAPNDVDAEARGRTIVLTFDDPHAPPPGATVFDLGTAEVRGTQDRFSDEVREFCRRRGIRFRPFAWRYRVGHCDGDRFIGR